MPLQNDDPFAASPPLPHEKLRAVITARRRCYLTLGYEPVPVISGRKRPALDRWQDVELDIDTVSAWADARPGELSTGIRARYTPGFDIDIRDQNVADQVEQSLLSMIPRGGTILKRVGLPPKRLIPFRCTAPFKKIAATFKAPDDVVHKIEVLCDGQQFVAEGIHEDTQLPYRWADNLDLLTVAHEHLPLVDKALAERFVAEASKIMERAGWVQIDAQGRSKKAKSVGKANNDGKQKPGIPYYYFALKDELDALAGAPKGDRNNALNRAAFNLFQLVAGGGLDEKVVRERLFAAAEACGLVADDGEASVRATIESGAKAGGALPRQAPEYGKDHDHGADQGEGVTLDDFFAYMPTHSYMYVPTRQMWATSSVNSRIMAQVLIGNDGSPILGHNGEPKIISASAWLDRNRPVEQMTWAPGLPMIIKDQLISEGGWIEHCGVSCFNLYRAPTIVPGIAAEAGPWLGHVRRVFVDDAEHMLDWLAHRVQHPADKINHALVLGGGQGIGKDSALEPVKRAIGPWNFIEVSPHHLLGRFNGFLKSVILRVSEARDLGDINRFQFYDHMKAYTAAPPDVLRVDEKHLPEYAIPNCCGVIITTNHKADGIYLPPDDRRHFVAWSNLAKEDFGDAYWNSLWGWYASGGDRHVAAYLAERDISKFNPKAPPPKTAAFWDIVDASRAPEDSELADVLDDMGNPDAVTLSQIRANTIGGFLDWLQDRKNRRVIPHRMEGAGYTPVRNNAAVDGQWKIDGTRQTVYAKSALTIRDRLAAASRLGR